MTTESRAKSRLPLVLAGTAVVVLLAAGGVWFFALRGEEEPPSPFLTHQEGDLLYSFHIPTGSEELYDLKADPGRHENLAGRRKEDAARLRRILTEKLGVKDLEELRKGPVIDALKKHGYM